MSQALEPYRVARRIGSIFEQLGVDWVLVGSLASSVHGIPRTTRDVDLAARLKLTHADALSAHLTPLGYVDRDAVVEAIRRSGSFNFIEDATSEKVDVFCVGARGAGQVDRAVPVRFADDLVLPVLSAEDCIVQKLRWYEAGGRQSGHQWQDVLDMLQVQGPSLRRDLLRDLGEEAGVELLLAKAVAEVGDRLG